VPAESRESEKALRRLQSVAREPSTGQSYKGGFGSRGLPDDLATEAKQALHYSSEEMGALKEANDAVLTDLRFEYLREKEVDEAVWRFFCQSFLERSTNHVPAFIATHARSVENYVCYLPVEYLSTTEEFELGDVRFLPPDHPDVPPVTPGFQLDEPIGCVVAVPARGTSYHRMAERATVVASHALRVLRIALREHRMIPHMQLRFRLDGGYSFGGRIVGWKRPEGEPVHLGLNDELIELVRGRPEARLQVTTPNDIEARANLAITWMERGWLAVEPLPAMLFFFFALEALLGDRRDRLKAVPLAFRQAMLGHAEEGGFEDPGRTYSLYDEVRSAAVHGGSPPSVDWKMTYNFGGQVRRTLIQFLNFAERNELKGKSELLKALDQHPDRDALAEWLRERGGEAWKDFK
jgi:hypothetical protein